MKSYTPRAPQQSLLFRIVAFFSRMQFWYLIRSMANKRLVTVVFVFTAGATALGTITVIAFLTDLMMLFPPLGPSAFILFHTPLAESASPRNVIMAHALALLAGLTSFELSSWVFPIVGEIASSSVNWRDVTAIAFAMGLTSIAMLGLRCIHPPAAATALIAAMGFLSNPVQVAGTLAAVLFLVAEAILFNRIIGGLPYPLWRFEADNVKNYCTIAGVPEHGKTYWQQMAAKTFLRRSSNGEGGD